MLSDRWTPKARVGVRIFLSVASIEKIHFSREEIFLIRTAIIGHTVTTRVLRRGR